MFKEILKIFPRLDTNDLNKMDRQLTQRFAKVAKKFGSGVKSVFMGGGIAGVALGLIEKILSPITEVQAAIDKTISHADDVVTNAKQFQSTPGELLKLQKLGEATGLDPQGMDTLLLKYQTALAEAKADPTKDTSVRNYANDENIVKSFFEFIQSMQKMAPDQQTMVQKEVFGEKQILKMADFIGANFAELLPKLKLRGASEYDSSLNSLGAKKDLTDELGASMSAEDTFKKGRLITENMIRAKAAEDQRTIDQENRNIARYQELMAISRASNEMLRLVQDGVGMLGSLIVKADKGLGIFEKIAMLRNMVPGGKK